jgi:hypothetical protein
MSSIPLIPLFFQRNASGIRGKEPPLAAVVRNFILLNYLISYII